MPEPLPKGIHIQVVRKKLQSEYSMPSLQMATDHYTIGYVISGDRRVITPRFNYCYHGGDVAIAPPYVYHRTVPGSNAPYESIMIKFSPDFAEPLLKAVGQNVLDEVYDRMVCRFSKETGERIGQLFEEIWEEYEKDRPYGEFILQGMLFRLLVTVWEERLPDQGAEQNSTALTPPVVDALSYMENFYSRSPSLEEVAGSVGFSTAYFSRLFREQLGMSFSEYLSRIKLRHVSELLAGTDKSIMEIAQETGYCHGNYLCEQFRKKVGMTPGQFRKKRKTDV